jgi:hypothetical protein
VSPLRSSLVFVALAAVLVLGMVTSSPAKEPPAVGNEPTAVLGVSTRMPAGTLAWFDPLTLQALRGRKVGLGYHTGSYAFSSNRATLALGECLERAGQASIRFVDARAMRRLGDVLLSNSYNCVSSLAWLQPHRLLAVLTRTDSSDAEIAVVDPATRHVLSHAPLPSAPVAQSATGQELALLFSNFDSIAPARVGVVDADGDLRTIVVDNIPIGTVVDQTGQDFRARTVSPGFAVDPEGRRAFLVPANGPVVQIDLGTLALSYHPLAHPSLLQRFLEWLTPAAEAKAIEGPVRQARWLGDGVLAVSGFDYSIADEGGQTEHVLAKPAGVELVDTASWRARMLSSDSSEVAVAAGLVIAEGGEWDEANQVTKSPGLLAFAPDGTKRWALHVGEERLLYDSVGSLGYVWLSQGKMEVVDLASGSLLQTIDRNEAANPWPWLLAAQRSG